DLLPPDVLRAARAAYYGLITQIDYHVGRLFAALQDLDLFNETVFLFTSDHGELLGDHHSGAKSFFYEGSAHVPFILRLPPSWEGRPVGTTIDLPGPHRTGDRPARAAARLARSRRRPAPAPRARPDRRPVEVPLLLR